MTVTSITRAATRSMRIIALPLTPPCRPSNGKPVEHLTYYHFVTPPDSRKSTWSKWMIAKASDLWAGLGKAPEGNWKRKAFLYGERLIDRLEFEELALKSLDPSLGPKLSDMVPHALKKQDAPYIPLIFPPSACASPIPHLHSLLKKRTPRHKKGFWFWLAVSPLTAPVALIPIIPNLPFFFCVWRSWSHYRAYKASQYLEAFLQQGAIIPQPSPALDAIYAKYAPPQVQAPALGSEEHPQPSHPPPPPSDYTSSYEDSDKPHPSAARAAAAAEVILLLREDAVPELQRTLDLPVSSTFMADVYRALEQARVRLRLASEGQTKS